MQVIFPNIVEKRDEVAYQGTGPARSNTLKQQGHPAAAAATASYDDSGQGGISLGGRGGGAAAAAAAAAAAGDSRNRFMSWMENTFMSEERDAAGLAAAAADALGEHKSHRC